MTGRQVPVVIVWLNGSFVSRKELPKNLDGVYFTETTYLNCHYQALNQVRNQYSLLHIIFAQLVSNRPHNRIFF